MYAFRGWCSFKQYIPSKPAKYGIKYWVLVDVHSSYVLDIDAYLGENSITSSKSNNIGEKVVLSLARPYFYKARRVITADNFFTSINLCKILWEKFIEFVGTLRRNKKEIPTCLLPDKKKQVDSCMFGFNNFLTLVSYVPKKNKSVIFLIFNQQ